MPRTAGVDSSESRRRGPTSTRAAALRTPQRDELQEVDREIDIERREDRGMRQAADMQQNEDFQASESIDPGAPDHDSIAFRAWEIWLSEGCPDGRDVDHWIRAEQECRRNIA